MASLSYLGFLLVVHVPASEGRSVVVGEIYAPFCEEREPNISVGVCGAWFPAATAADELDRWPLPYAHLPSQWERPRRVTVPR